MGWVPVASSANSNDSLLQETSKNGGRGIFSGVLHIVIDCQYGVYRVNSVLVIVTAFLQL